MPDVNTLYVISGSAVDSAFPFTGSAQILGNLGVTGSIIVSSSNGIGFPSLSVSGSSLITGSLGVTGSLSITGSVDMNVVSTPITTATMSLNFALGNYFTGSASGSFHISASNLKPGETGILKMNTAFAALPT